MPGFKWFDGFLPAILDSSYVAESKRLELSEK